MPATSGRLIDQLLIGLLTVVGFVFGVMSVMFLDCYVGSVPVPYGILIAAAGNAALRAMAGWHGESTRAQFAPLGGWAVPVMISILWGGPGGDTMFLQDWRAVLLLVAGIGGAMVVHWKRPTRT